MAVYKVAQDVEAEDKLLGPFSFRQFIYLLIAIGGIGLAWGLSRITPILIIIPMPIILLFGILALPLRKDQPMEVYLAAIISFYLKPKRRLWTPDGVDKLVEIIAPKIEEVSLTKDLSETEAQKRLSYLADIADTRGWAVRHISDSSAIDSSMNEDFYYEAQQTDDILDTTGSVGNSFDQLLNKANNDRRTEILSHIQQLSQQPVVDSTTQNPIQTPPNNVIQNTAVVPNQIQQQYNYQPQQTQPIQGQPIVNNIAPENHQDTSVTAVSSDIIILANNSELSVETIQREAKRIRDKHNDDDGEVFISLH